MRIFEESLFFKLRTTIQQKTVKPTYRLSVRCQEAVGRKRRKTGGGVGKEEGGEEGGKIQNTQEIKRTLFNQTKQDKTCKFSRKSSVSSYVQQYNREQLNQLILCHFDVPLISCVFLIFFSERCRPTLFHIFLCVCFVIATNKPSLTMTTSFFCFFFGFLPPKKQMPWKPLLGFGSAL